MQVPLAPIRPREARGPWLPILPALLVLLGAASPQDDPASAKGAETPAKKSDSPAAAPAPAPTEAFKIEPQQWAEPRRFELIENDFEELTSPPLTPAERERLTAMFTGRQAGEAALFRKHIAHHAGELTRRNNIQSLIDSAESAGASKGAKAMEQAGTELLRPLLEPNFAASSRQAYVSELVTIAPKLLDGHLHTRSMFMTVLSRSGSPEVVPLLAEQIADEDQAHTVKLLAAVGLSEIARRQPLDPARAIAASRAVSSFLDANPDTFWLIKVRMLEAIGALRQATGNPLQADVELAAAPFLILADPSERTDVRAAAGWALGMLSVPAQVRRYNFELVAYEMGRAAAAIGEQILALPIPEEQPTRNLRMVPRLTDPLLKLLSGFVGEESLRGSGLNRATHPEAANALEMIRGVEQRIRAVSTSAIEFSRSIGSQVPSAQRRLAGDVQELKSFLARNVPKSPELYAGGPTVSLPTPPAAGGSRPTTRPAAEPKKGESGASSR